MARAMAEAMAPPMLEFAICCMSIISGKTRESPARASGPNRPTKWASTVAVMAMSTTFTTTLGAARRSSVETMGPSSRRRVREAPGVGREIAGAAWAIDPLPLVIGNSWPREGTGAALGRERLGKTGRLRLEPDWMCTIQFLSRGATHHFSGQAEY